MAKALLGKAALPDDLPFVTGSVGWLGTSASNEMMTECDTLLMIGSGFPYTEFLPQAGQARGVQIDIDPGMLEPALPDGGRSWSATVAETLRALLPLLEPKEDRSWSERVEALVEAWQEDAEQRPSSRRDPVNPQLALHRAVDPAAGQCIIAADSGTSTVWYARHLPMRDGMQASVSGTLATMGCALPVCVGAKFGLSGPGGVRAVR